MLRKTHDKHGAIWCILGVPKYLIINLKISNFKIMNQQQPKSFAIFFSKINPDAHVSTKMITLIIYKRVCGATAPRSQKKKKKSLKINQNGGFSFFYLIT